MRIFELPKYWTIKIGGIIEEIENVNKFEDLIVKFNRARDETYKYIIQEFGDLKSFLQKKFNKTIKRYEDWKALSEKFERMVAGFLRSEVTYQYIQNKIYADTVALKVYSTLKSLNCLRDKLRSLGEYKLVNELPNDNEIEFGTWLFIESLGDKDVSSKGNRNIKLFKDGTLRITYAIRNYIYGKWSCKGKKYSQVINKLLTDIENGNYIPYTARVLIAKEFCDKLVLDIHITLPFDYVFGDIKQIYAPNTGRITGHDVNVDRINDVIVRVKDLKLVKHKTFWFDEANVKNINSDRIWTTIEKKIRESIVWNMKHQSYIHAFEDYELIGDWKFIDLLRNKPFRNPESNWRKYSFRSSVIEEYGIELYKLGLPKPYLINPSFTSKLAEETCYFFGLDRHTMSAYYTAVLYLLKQELNNKNYQ